LLFILVMLILYRFLSLFTAPEKTAYYERPAWLMDGLIVLVYEFIPATNKLFSEFELSLLSLELRPLS